MLKLIAKHAQAQQAPAAPAEEKGTPIEADDQHTHTQQNNADGRHEAQQHTQTASPHLHPPAASSALASSDAFDLSASPLGLVSGLGSSLLQSVGQTVSTAVHKGGDAANRITSTVKRGVEKGVEGFERRVTRNNTSSVADEENESDSTVGWESKSDTRVNSGRRMSWSDMKSASDELSASGDGLDDDSVGSAMSAVAIAPSPDASLTSTDSVVLRMNFIRLLHRCESISFDHLHPGANSSAPESSLKGPRAQRSFTRSVTLLRDMLSEFRRRRLTIQASKENASFVRRVAFLSTLAEKYAAVASASALHDAQTRTNQIRCPRPPPAIATTNALAYGVHSVRSTTALLASVNAAAMSASAASSSSTLIASDPTDPLLYDEGIDSLIDRSSPSAHEDRSQDIRELLFARQAQRDSARASTAATATATATQSHEFTAELEQRKLVNDLHDMTDTLKENAMRLRRALASDAKVIDAVDAQLDNNLHAITHENSRLAKWASTGCSEMCWNILLIVTVWVVFIGMFIFMKIFPAPK